MDRTLFRTLNQRPPVAATQAEQETGTSATVFVTPGRQQYHPSSVKGWVKHDVSATAQATYNVGSMTDNGSADWSTNWDVDFSSANYSAWMGFTYTAGNFNRMIAARGQTAATLQVATFSTGGADEGNVGAIFIGASGDQ